MATAQELVAQGYGGYSGWGDVEAAADFAATGGAGKKTASSTPSSPEQVNSYLETYQQNLLSQSNDPALQALIGTYAPALAGTTTGGGFNYAIPEEFEGKTLSQIGDQFGYGSLEGVANLLGISNQDTLTAGQTFNITPPPGVEPSGSSEFQVLEKHFKAPTPVQTGAEQAAGVPQPISRVEEFERLRTEMGVADMESYLVDLKAQEEFLYAELRARTGRERGEPIPQGVIEGRIGEIERQQMERIDTIRRLKQTVTDQLNVAYGVISTYINYMGADYQDAVNAYNDEFQRNIQIYNLISGAKQAQVEEARFRTQLQIDQIQNQQNIASANLQTMMNAITSGNLSYNDLPAEQQSMIRKLEVQAGLPAGFTEGLKMNPNDQVLFQTSNEGITQVGFIQPDGSVRVEEYGRRISSGGGGSDKLTEADYRDYLVEDVRGYANLDSVMKFYGTYLEPSEILRLYNTNSPFGVATESEDELAERYGVKF